MTNFCKSEDCPSSDELLEYQNNDQLKTRRDEISKHLSKCEFCSAEVDFYSRYPQEENSNETVEAAGIPEPLFELAEALLKNRHLDASCLDVLLKKKTNPVAQKAEPLA